jgi:hypothetical protein
MPPGGSANTKSTPQMGQVGLAWPIVATLRPLTYRCLFGLGLEIQIRPLQNQIRPQGVKNASAPLGGTGRNRPLADSKQATKANSAAKPNNAWWRCAKSGQCNPPVAICLRASCQGSTDATRNLNLGHWEICCTALGIGPPKTCHGGRRPRRVLSVAGPFLYLVFRRRRDCLGTNFSCAFSAARLASASAWRIHFVLASQSQAGQL